MKYQIKVELEVGKTNSGKRVKNFEVMKTRIHHSGYEVIDLTINDNKTNHGVHRLLAKSFIPNPDNKRWVNHKDGNKTNNIVPNLEWVTPKENINHAWENGLCTAQKGEDHGCSFLKKKDVIKIRNLYKNNTLNQREISELYNVCKSTISKIIRRKTWKHV